MRWFANRPDPGCSTRRSERSLHDRGELPHVLAGANGALHAGRLVDATTSTVYQFVPDDRQTARLSSGNRSVRGYPGSCSMSWCSQLECLQYRNLLYGRATARQSSVGPGDVAPQMNCVELQNVRWSGSASRGVVCDHRRDLHQLGANARRSRRSFELIQMCPYAVSNCVPPSATHLAPGGERLGAPIEGSGAARDGHSKQEARQLNLLGDREAPSITAIEAMLLLVVFRRDRTPVDRRMNSIDRGSV